MHEAVMNTVSPILRFGESEYSHDSVARELGTALSGLKERFVVAESAAKSIASTYVNRGNQKQRSRFYRTIERSVGISLEGMVAEEGLENVLDARVSENVSLIRSIPEEYFKKIEFVINEGVITKTPQGGIIKAIQEVKGVTDKRAKVIARDQTSKLINNLNEVRQTAVGIEEYEWNVADRSSRTRATHLRNNKKIFRWDDPPKTGHPGYEVQCRCWARPIIPARMLNAA